MDGFVSTHSHYHPSTDKVKRKKQNPYNLPSMSMKTKKDSPPTQTVSVFLSAADLSGVQSSAEIVAPTPFFSP
jgi:hypothetical protein